MVEVKREVFRRANPVINISVCSDLQSISQGLSRNYQLTQNVDCSNISFVPIGTYPSSPFNGTLEGNNFKICNFTLNVTSNNVGLFSYTLGANVQNLIFLDFFVNAISSNYVGVVAGRAESTFMTNITLTSSGGAQRVLGGSKMSIFFLHKIF